MNTWRLWLSAGTFCVCAVSSLAYSEGWVAGLARSNITPTEPMPMAGYSSRGSAVATDRIHDLWAKALYLRDAEGHEAVLVTMDIVGIDRRLSQRICDQLQQAYQWQRSQILLSTSHTHSGPVIGKNLSAMHYMVFDPSVQSLVVQYENTFFDRIIQLVAEAREAAGPADLNWTSDRETFAVNRRNNPEAEVPERRSAGSLVGPVDPDVPVLSIRRDGRVIGLVFGYACHCTTLSGMKWSGDYAGHAQAELELMYPDCVAMFWAGCGGDQNPIPRREEALAEAYGKRLAGAVQRGIEGVSQSIAPTLATSFEEIPLPFDTLPSREQLDGELLSKDRFIASRAKMLIEQIDAGKPLSPTYPYPISFWRLGNEIDWFALGGEVVVDYALRIKREQSASVGRSPESVWVMGYAHDVMAYIPSRRVLTEGGYEGGGAMVYYGQPTRWAPTIETLILSATKKVSGTNGTGLTPELRPAVQAIQK